MKIGVVSDTHGFFDARLGELLAGVELILHAGDVGGQEILHELERIAPVRAVQGNIDSPHLDLPLSLTLTLGEGSSRLRTASTTTMQGGGEASGSIQVELLHVLPAAQTDLEKWALRAREEGRTSHASELFRRALEPNTRVIIFGHSHVPCAVTLDGKLFFNPGSAGKQRFSLPRCCGLLELSRGSIEATILSLQQYNKKLPEKVRLSFGGQQRCRMS